MTNDPADDSDVSPILRRSMKARLETLQFQRGLAPAYD
jgi:hypothetical protein